MPCLIASIFASFHNSGLTFSEVTISFDPILFCGIPAPSSKDYSVVFKFLPQHLNDW